MEGERGLSGKSMLIHNISAEFPSCSNERTIKYADTYVPELCTGIYEPAKARIKYPDGMRR